MWQDKTSRKSINLVFKHEKTVCDSRPRTGKPTLNLKRLQIVEVLWANSIAASSWYVLAASPFQIKQFNLPLKIVKLILIKGHPYFYTRKTQRNLCASPKPKKKKNQDSIRKGIQCKISAKSTWKFGICKLWGRLFAAATPNREKTDREHDDFFQICLKLVHIEAKSKDYNTTGDENLLTTYNATVSLAIKAGK